MSMQLIYEDCTAICTPANRSIIYEEQKFIHDKPYNKVIFRTKLQTANEVNGNNRYYSHPFCKSIVESLNSKAKARSLFQEVDHPMVADPKSQIAKSRAVVIEMKNVGSMLRRIYMEGNDIVGEVETLSGFLGPDLGNVITVDKANIGFSARLFAQMKPHGYNSAVQEVCGPFKAITYDVVTNPSHSSARIIDFISENHQIDPALYECISDDFVQETEDYSSNGDLKDFFVDTLNTKFNDLAHTKLFENYG